MMDDGVVFAKTKKEFKPRGPETHPPAYLSREHPFEPLYSLQGGPARAYLCYCGNVKKSKRGILLHLIRRHQIKLQRALFKKIGEQDELAKDRT